MHPMDTTVCQGTDPKFTCVVAIPSSGAVSTPVLWVRGPNMDNVDMMRHSITSHMTTCPNITDNQINETAPDCFESTVTVINVTVDADNGSNYSCGILSEYSENAVLYVESKCIHMSCFFDVHSMTCGRLQYNVNIL